MACTRFYISMVFLMCSFSILSAQIIENTYLGIETTEAADLHHEIKIDNGYFVYSSYTTNPAGFIKTLGGFYEIADNKLKVKLEFNSAFAKDSVKQITIPFEVEDESLYLNLGEKIRFTPVETINQELDGQWLFGTRGPDNGQERRGDSRARKTLKFLLNGKFQWIAYNTETFKFSGTGGGTFTSVNGVYQENIEYFSRDNNRVGAKLDFQYELQQNDWHHKGKNSKGEPMYEIWMRRD